MRVWSISDAQRVLTITRDTARFIAVEWPPGDGMLYTSSRDGWIEVWSSDTGERIAGFEPGHASVTDDWEHRRNLVFGVSSDASLVATGGVDGAVRLWRRSDWDLVYELSGHDDRVQSLEFSPDGRELATAGFDGQIRIHDTRTGNLIRSLRGHDSGNIQTATYSPDGRRILTSALEPIHKLWDRETGQPMLVLRGHEAASSSATFSGDGRMVISADTLGVVRIWDAPGFTP